MSRWPALILGLTLLLSGCASSTSAGTDTAESHTAGTRAAPTHAAGTHTTGTDAAGRWRPVPGSTWQYQLSGTLDLTVAADVYDVDWENTTAEEVARLHAAGRRAVCYVNAGAYEDWRPDASSYPSAVLGAALDGWPGERWLDVRRTDVLLPILGARIDVCRAKGFDAVEADNVDGYANRSGFPLRAGDQIRFDTAVAGLAHERGLSVALKNDVDQIEALEPSFDFAVNEECLAYDECDAYGPFLSAGKAVLSVEYTAASARLCARAKAAGLTSTVFKQRDLGPPLTHC